MSDILKKIIENTTREVRERKAITSCDEYLDICRSVEPALDYFTALSGETPRIIAECKKMSPSKGILCDPYSPKSLSTEYESGGAAAISCLTDENFFGGTLMDLECVKKAVKIPVMRKDFIIDEYQIAEARAHGADSFLLLSGILDKAKLLNILNTAETSNGATCRKPQ